MKLEEMIQDKVTTQVKESIKDYYNKDNTFEENTDVDNDDSESTSDDE